MDSARLESTHLPGHPDRRTPRRYGKRSSAQCRKCRSCPLLPPSFLRWLYGSRRGPAGKTLRRWQPGAQAHARGCSALRGSLDPARRTPAVSRRRHRRSERALAPVSDRLPRPCTRPPGESVSPKSRRADFSQVLRIRLRPPFPQQHLDPISPRCPARNAPLYIPRGNNDSDRRSSRSSHNC